MCTLAAKWLSQKVGFGLPNHRTEPDIFLPNRTVPNRTRHIPKILILLKNAIFKSTKHGKFPSKATFCEIVGSSNKI